MNAVFRGTNRFKKQIINLWLTANYKHELKILGHNNDMYTCTLRRGKLKRKRELINHKIAQKWSLYYDLFTKLREKPTHTHLMFNV